jgi:RimJ/RimL family protein N-acetyltransferase
MHHYDMLVQHEITLRNVSPSGENIKLRPMTEDDWDVLLKWNSDPEVLYYSEGNDVTSYNLEEIIAQRLRMPFVSS